MISLRLPFPPSVNGYWRAIVRGDHAENILSVPGREYRTKVISTVVRSGYYRRRLSGRLSVEISLHRPDRRSFDVDNFAKGIFDGLTAAGVWIDDSQVDRLTITRGCMAPGGLALVEISELAESKAV